MDKKKYIWIIVVIIIAIIYGRMDSKNKIILPLVLLGICIVALICVFIWIIRENICLKKYGPEETVEIKSIILKEKNINQYAQILSNGKTDSCDEETLIENYTVRISMKTKTQELLKKCE